MAADLEWPQPFPPLEGAKPCRPIYCARHYGGEDVPCVRAYHCPGVVE